MRLSIELSPEQHYRIKAMAALQGKSMKDWVLEKLFTDADKITDDSAAWEELKTFLKQRMDEAKSTEAVTMSITEIAEDILRRHNEL